MMGRTLAIPIYKALLCFVILGVVLKDLLGSTTGCINFIQVVVFSKATI